MAMGAGVWFGDFFVKWRCAIVGVDYWQRNLADNLMLWLLVFLVGSALPLVLRLVLIGSDAKAA